jgi:hypothetical protein
MRFCGVVVVLLLLAEIKLLNCRVDLLPSYWTIMLLSCSQIVLVWSDVPSLNTTVT